MIADIRRRGKQGGKFEGVSTINLKKLRLELKFLTNQITENSERFCGDILHKIHLTISWKFLFAMVFFYHKFFIIITSSFFSFVVNFFF
jgi:hypothetical protein